VDGGTLGWDDVCGVGQCDIDGCAEGNAASGTVGVPVLDGCFVGVVIG